MFEDQVYFAEELLLFSHEEALLIRGGLAKGGFKIQILKEVLNDETSLFQEGKAQ